MHAIKTFLRGGNGLVAEIISAIAIVLFVLFAIVIVTGCAPRSAEVGEPRIGVIESCQDSVAGIEAVIEAFDPGARYSVMPDESHALFMARFNAMEPVTDFQPDEIRVYDHSRHGALGIVLIRGDCVLYAVLVPPGAIRELLGRQV